MPRMIRGGGIFEENGGEDLLQVSVCSEISSARIPSGPAHPVCALGALYAKRRADMRFYNFPCSRSACTLVGRPQMLMNPSASAWLKSLSPNVTRFSEYREYGETMPALIRLPL